MCCMAMGTRQSEQASLWVATAELPKSPGHPFYTRLNALLDAGNFDRFAEGQCARFYAPVMGRPSLAPGRYFRLLLVGYFEGIDSERGIAWGASDSLATGALVPVTLQDADQGDTTTIIETVIAAAEQIEEAQAGVQTPQLLAEIIADKGYHSNQMSIQLEPGGLRSYVAEPDRGRRDWSKEPAAQTLVYANRRRIRGARGRHLMRQRGERIERSFAHLSDTPVG